MKFFLLFGIVNLTAGGRKKRLFAESWLSCTYHILPNLERPRSQYPVVDRLDTVATETKEILGKAVQRQKSLSLSRGRKPSHMAFPLTRGFVRHFRAVVGIDVIEMIHGRHHRAVSGIIASQFVSD